MRNFVLAGVVAAAGALGLPVTAAAQSPFVTQGTRGADPSNPYTHGYYSPLPGVVYSPFQNASTFPGGGSAFPGSGFPVSGNVFVGPPIGSTAFGGTMAWNNPAFGSSAGTMFNGGFNVPGFGGPYTTSYAPLGYPYAYGYGGGWGYGGSWGRGGWGNGRWRNNWRGW